MLNEPMHGACVLAPPALLSRPPQPLQPAEPGVDVGCVCGASSRRVSICTFVPEFVLLYQYNNRASICTFVPVCAALPRDAHSAFSRVCRTVASLASALSVNSMQKAAASLAT